MRPVRLTIQAFGPYPARQVIDFRPAVEAGLFGVYGQTGSGKSTLFSAMTFALFGEPAKPEQDAPSLRSDHADADLPTEVEFVFDIGERRFVILRSPEQKRPKQRGAGETREAHKALLFDATGLALVDLNEGHRGKIIAERKVREVDAAITGLLGYGVDQFRQIVLLPQGKFETFLIAKTKDRLKILRELFDVSLFRRLTAKLKADAEAAESHVRDERKICIGRLTAEGFESPDALTAGIADADGLQTGFVAAEDSALLAGDAAGAALAGAKETEARFKAEQIARAELARLQASTPEMDALAGRIRKAESAQLLLDLENNLTNAVADIGKAEAGLKTAQETAARADDAARKTAAALKQQTNRAGEIEALRREVIELQRQQGIIERSKGIAQSVEQAGREEHAAKARLNDVQGRLSALIAAQSKKSDACKAARRTEDNRQQLTACLTARQFKLTSAEIFEQAQNDAGASTDQVLQLTSSHRAAARLANEAKAEFKAAEQDLSQVQALHLARKLEQGAPCPVCGSADHPAPVTGVVEHEGLDEAFRDTKTAWSKADAAARSAEKELSSAQSVLEERQTRLTGLEHPDEQVAALREKIGADQHALHGLGPQTDITAAEAEIERLSAQIAALETERDTCRDEYGMRQSQTIAEQARLDEMLSDVPENYRDGALLAAAIADRKTELTRRQQAQETSVRADRQAREAALSSQKDFEAAGQTLTDCRQRRDRAQQQFYSRLEQSSLTPEEFTALKPAITEIESSRDRVEEHRRKLNNAKEAAVNAARAIKGQTRPDLPEFEQAVELAAAKLREATEQRLEAEQHLKHLTRLLDELSGILARMDAAEEASGPLRNLAALCDGNNRQKLDLETFAIGAMFDQVLEMANLRLGPMTANRYRLDREVEGSRRGRRGLGIQVFDIFTGKGRPTASLSGGETFIAALALALGLADVVESANGRIRLDTIFIDEGFGSLDTENGSGTLDQVLQVLSTLVRQNRAVGLISHVPLVQEAIPNGFYIRKELTGSHVEVLGSD